MWLTLLHVKMCPFGSFYCQSAGSPQEVRVTCFVAERLPSKTYIKFVDSAINQLRKIWTKTHALKMRCTMLFNVFIMKETCAYLR